MCRSVILGCAVVLFLYVPLCYFRMCRCVISGCAVVLFLDVPLCYFCMCRCAILGCAVVLFLDVPFRGGSRCPDAWPMLVPRWHLELFQMSRCPVPEAQMASPEAQMRFTEAQMRHQIPDVQRPQRAPSRCPEGRKSACARRGGAPRGACVYIQRSCMH